MVPGGLVGVAELLSAGVAQGVIGGLLSAIMSTVRGIFARWGLPVRVRLSALRSLVEMASVQAVLAERAGLDLVRKVVGYVSTEFPLVKLELDVAYSMFQMMESAVVYLPGRLTIGSLSALVSISVWDVVKEKVLAGAFPSVESARICSALRSSRLLKMEVARDRTGEVPASWLESTLRECRSRHSRS
jgi:hypothetical protein